MPIDPGLPGGRPIQDDEIPWWENPDNPLYDGDGDGIPDSWVINGPFSYKCAYYKVIFVPGSTDLGSRDQWFGEVYSDPEATAFLYGAVSFNGSGEVTDLVKLWIDQYCEETVTPPPMGSIDLISQDYDIWRGSYEDCIDVGIPLSDMEFVQTTNANLNRTFLTDSTKSDVLVIGPVPEGIKIPVSVTIEAIDESFPAGTRNEDYKESHTVYLEGGDVLELASNGVAISLSITRDGSEIVDQLSVSNLHAKYTKSGVEVKVGQIQSCTISGENEEEDSEEETEEEMVQTDKDTLWMILGFLVLLILGGWILHTTKEGGD